MTTPKGRRRTVLSEDGELRDVDEDSGASQPEPIYCTRCGTANTPDSKYCRKCGLSLEEQEADLLGVPGYDRSRPKSKNDLVEEAVREERMAFAPAGEQRSASAAAVTQILTMLCVAVMGIVAVTSHFNTAAIIPIVIGWISVEAIRGGFHRGLTAAAALTTIFTTIFISVLSIIAVTSPSGAAIIPLMIAWVVIEALRGH